jgi:protein-S-isoprenylcysteine O-methyltransferase Ste14
MGWTRRIIPPGWLLLTLLGAVAMQRWAPLRQLWHAPASSLGTIPLVLGLFLAVCGVDAFRRARTSVVPFTTSSALVTTGIYRFTRNPMYLGLILMLFGTACLLGSLGAFLPLPALVWILTRGYIHAEERFLENLFGSEYLRYKNGVRRWL